jgi:DNA-binding GntR family transcriptional regulator
VVYGLAVSIDNDSPDATYVQLATILRGKIESGEITGRLPSITDLIQEHGIAKNTVRRAISVLADAGLVVTVPGRGTFTVERK